MLNVRDFGAVGDGVHKDTAAIQAAIDAAWERGLPAREGCGEAVSAPRDGEGAVATSTRQDAVSPSVATSVLLPGGIWLSGTLYLKSGVELHLAEGAVLKASPDPADYNAADAFPQNWGSPRTGDNQSGGHLLVAVGAERVALRGPGKIDGNAPAFLRLPDGSHPPTKHDIPWRPGQMVCFVECRDVAIRDTRYAVNAVGAWSKPARGVDIRRVTFEDMDIEARGFCKFYYKFATESVFEDILFRDVRGTVREPSIFDDTPERPFRNLRFEGVRLDGETSPRVR